MRLIFILLFLGMTLCLSLFGKETRLTLSESIECVVLAPAVVEEGRRYPVLFYLHGTGGNLSLGPLRTLISSYDIFLVGLTYSQKGLLTAGEEEVQVEVERFIETRKSLSAQLPLDENQIYVSGFSKGGWISSYLIERDPAVKGAMIMGAGALSNWPEVPTGSLAGKSVYIGCGVEDKNHINSLRADKRYRSSGARVTLDLWDQVGHRFPRKEVENGGSKQWLDREFQSPELFAKLAKQWAPERLKEIRVHEPVGERCYQLVRFGKMPYLEFFGRKGQDILQTELRSQQKNLDFAKEFQAYQKWSALLGEELKSRKVSDLKDYVRGYESLMEDYPESLTRKYAVLEKKRIEEVLAYVGR